MALRLDPVRRRARRQLSTRLDMQEIFPSVEAELGPYRHLFTGRVLNAGAGDRDISGLVEGQLYNQDLADGLHNGPLDLVGPLHAVPVADGFFDVVICNAVLEHVANPEQVMDEFARVLRPGGILYLTIPFLQPEHRDPRDFQRYTLEGIKLLCARHGFEVLEAGGVHSVYATLAWVAREYFATLTGFRAALISRLAFWWLRRRMAAEPARHVPALASAHRVIARRPAAFWSDRNGERLPEDSPTGWS